MYRNVTDFFFYFADICTKWKKKPLQFQLIIPIKQDSFFHVLSCVQFAEIMLNIWHSDVFKGFLTIRDVSGITNLQKHFFFVMNRILVFELPFVKILSFWSEFILCFIRTIFIIVSGTLQQIKLWISREGITAVQTNLLFFSLYIKIM
jgi:hypothetical protein